MNLRKLSLINSLYAFACFTALTDSLLYDDVYWTTAIQLSEYDGYRSVSLLSYEVPAQATKAIFTFLAKTSGSSCRAREVHVYFQQGSYPLVTPYNETFPPDFYLNRTGAFYVKIKQDADAVSYIQPMPRPGVWYFAAFLSKSSDEIKQKGLGKSCQYGMVVVVEAKGIDNIPDISTQNTQRISLSQTFDSSLIYRFQLPKDTVQYSVRINNCNMKYQHVVYRNVEQSLVANKTEKTSYTELNTTQQQNTTESTTISSTNLTTIESTTNATTPPTSPAPMTSNHCPVIAYIQSSMLPGEDSLLMDDCGNVTDCRKEVLSPTVEDWTYITVEIDNRFNVSEVSFDLQFEVKECESLKFLLPKMIVQRLQRSKSNGYSGPNQDSCVRMSSLGRFDWAKETFNLSYLFVDQMAVPSPLELDKIPVEDNSVLVTSFSVLKPNDLGGTLVIEGHLELDTFDTQSQTVVMYVCVISGALPGGQTVRPCSTGVALKLNMTETQKTVYVPYPEAGTWYLGLNAQCFSKKSGSEEKCTSTARVGLRLAVTGCVDGGCGQYGECVSYISGIHVFSSCKCFAGWQGYGCTDGSKSRSRGEELLAVLLLTISNIFFIPSAVLAIYRKYYVEAAIYVFTMFMSTFYHACDTSDLVYFCLLHYDILSFADFLGSISSFWVTMLVMSKVPRQFRGFAQTVGAVGIAVGVEYDRHGLLVFAIPAGLAAVIMFGSWIFQCGKKKSLYPSKRYLLAHLLPGVVLAVVGLVLFAFLETDDNYMYTHSCWHIAMSTSIVFLLPSRQTKDSTSQELPLVTEMESDNSISLDA